MKLHQNTKIIEQFCKYVSSQLCVIDFVYQSKKLEIADYDINAISTLIFPFNDNDVYTSLIQAEYVTFLEKIIEKIQLIDECRDIFRSELSDELLELLELALAKQKERISISLDSKNLALVLHIPDFISDLYLPLLSQLHTEITLTCRQFLDFVPINKPGETNLFLNSKSATPYSRFIEMWVMSALGILPKPIKNIIVA